MRILISLCFLFSSQGWAQSEWQTIHEQDGIKVERRERKDSSLIAFRGEAWVDAPLVRVASVLYDAQRSLEWVEDLGETRIVKWFSTNSYMEYDRMKTPPFLRDRDFVSKVVIDINSSASSLSFTYTDLSEAETPADLRNLHYVRGLLNGSRFVLTASPDGQKTKVEAEIDADPKGMIPNWLVNLFQQDWPVHTFRALRHQVAKPDIQNDPKIVELLTAATNANPKKD